MDWDFIQKMRQGFLDNDGHLPDYWHDERWLEAYDQTLAQRIRWKWQAVLEELKPRWPQGLDVKLVVDWGCGTGIATRSFLASGIIEEPRVLLFDRSSGAMRYAARALQRESSKAKVELMKRLEIPREAFILLVSHVLSEVDERSLAELQTLCAAAAAVIWVEPGRSLESRRLSLLRDASLKSHRSLGPCRHQSGCGVLEAGRDKDWCHFFAPVPREVHHSAFWREFSQRMKVDLRSLPVAWLALIQHQFMPVPARAEDAALILSRPRVFKGHCRWLACTASGLCSGDFQKKHDKTIYEALREPEFMTVLPLSQLRRNDDAPL